MKSISQHNASRSAGCASPRGFLGFLVLLFLAGCSSSARPAGETEAKLSVTELQEKLTAAEVSIRLGAVHGLRRHGPGAAPSVPDLIRLLKADPELPVRQAAALALGEIGPAAVPAVPDLTRVVQKETDSPLRRQAAAALGKIGSAAKAALPALKQAAKDAPPIVRQAAEEAVRQILVSR